MQLEKAKTNMNQAQGCNISISNMVDNSLVTLCGDRWVLDFLW